MSSTYSHGSGAAPDRGVSTSARSFAQTLGAAGLLAVTASVAASGMILSSNAVVNTSGQLLLKISCLAAVVIGMRRHRHLQRWFWRLLAGYFAFSTLRNISRVLTAVTEGSWTTASGPTWEFTLNLLAASCGAAAAIALMLACRTRGNHAVADALVIGVGLLVAFVRITTIPTFREFGLSPPFWSNGVAGISRDVIELVAVLIVLYSQRIRSASVAVLVGALAILASASLLYNAIGANVTGNAGLTSKSFLVLGGLQSVGQVMIALAALMPAIGRLGQEADVTRPTWDVRRTLAMCSAVLAPVVAVTIAGPMNRVEFVVVMCGFAVLLLLLVLRLRLAATTTNTALNELRFTAFHDVLTGLNNRAHLQQKIVPALETRGLDAPESIKLSCCYIDVDDLKETNDRVNHQAGDQLLMSVADSLRSVARSDRDDVIRIGGDEFVVLSRIDDDAPDPDAQARSIGERVSASLNQQISVTDAATADSFQPRASIGSSWQTLTTESGTLGRKLDHLIHQADLAQVAAKHAGGGRIAYYSDELGIRARRRTTLAKSVPAAIASGEMFLAYQPVVRLSDGAVYGAESLLRWTHPELGAIPPPEVIQTSEDLGLINDLGLQILDRALDSIATPNVAAHMRIGVNLSAHQLRPKSIDQILEYVETRGTASQLWLEVTEQLLVENRQYAAGALNELRNAGVMVAIDDFGAGYCGLDYLCTIPVDVVKLDGAFAKQIDSATRRRVARLGVQLADAIGAEALAEGIETYETARIMQDLGCTYGQGYAFRRPTADLAVALAPIDEFDRLTSGIMATSPGSLDAS